MSDAVPLPPRPDVEQYKKLAKDLQAVCRSPDLTSFRHWADRLLETIARLNAANAAPTLAERERQAMRLEQRWNQFKASSENAQRCTLTSAQFFIAREHGFSNWPAFEH